MTAIYNRINKTGYEIAVSTNGYDTDEAIRRLAGPSRKHDWKPLLVQLVRAGPRRASKPGKPADLPFTGIGLIMRQSAVDALQDILDANGEILPLVTETGVELFVFNPRFILKAFDEKNTVYERYDGSSYFKIHKFVFIESVVRGIDVFYTTFGPRELYFSDRFVARVKKARLKGTEFHQLWSSE